MTVDRPPHPVEDLKKILRSVTAYGDPARERTVDMVMRIDKPRHYNTAARIDKLRAFIFTAEQCRIADFNDKPPVNSNTAVFDQLIRRTPRDEPPVTDKEHKTPPAKVLKWITVVVSCERVKHCGLTGSCDRLSMEHKTVTISELLTIKSYQ